MEDMIKMLVAQGIDAAIAESMVKSFKPKKEKTKKNAFFAGKATPKKKEIEVEVTIICECCRNTWQEVKTVIVKDDDSPDKMRLPVSSCKECPDFFRAMTHEQLVSLCLAAHNPSIMHAYPRTTSQVKLAKKLSPEEILVFKAN